MKAYLVTFLSLLGLGALACNLNLTPPRRVQTGPTQTLTINEAAPATDTAVHVELSMGAASLNLSGGASGLVEGSIRYNVAEWEPVVTRSSDAARLSIEQPPAIGDLVPADRVVNEWNLNLGHTPMELTINAGAYQSFMNLSGIPLRRLSISEGAADAELIFQEPNPATLEQLTYHTGASSVRLEGLGYANFVHLDFEGGVGAYTLDFAGPWQQDSQVNVKAGLSAVRIVVPASTAVRVNVTGGLSDVSTVGDWSLSGDAYVTAGHGPTLTVNVEMGMGSLTLVEG